MKRLVYLFFLLLTGGAAMAAPSDTIPASSAKDYVGKRVTVCDKITEARLADIAKDEPDVLFTGPDYEHRTLALVFTNRALKRFPYNPNLKMINNTFYLHGKVVMYQGKPAIIIRDDKQLNVAE